MKITIPGCPITKKNSMQLIRRGNKPAIIPSRQFLRYQENAGKYIAHKWFCIDFPVNIQCVYYMPTRRKVDLCNLLGATCDVLVHYGVIQDDNSRIVIGHDGSRVLYDKENPRVEIEIAEVLSADL